MKTFRLRILAAERTFYDGPCQSLTVPTIDGRYGLMAQHENVVIAIIPGELTLHTESGEEQIAAVSEGMLKMEDNEALVRSIPSSGPRRSTSTALSRSPQRRGPRCAKSTASRSARSSWPTWPAP